MNIRVLQFDSVDSTNLEALRQARLGAPEGLCVTALQQTAGRGRRGRSWTSEPGAGLFATILLRPKLGAEKLPLLTLMTAVAVFDALTEAVNIQPDIKWPNDILVNDRKICGILAESAETGTGLAIAVGFGINLETPPGLSDSATSVTAEGGFADRNELLSAVTRKFGEYYVQFQEPEGTARMIENWRLRSSYFAGKLVTAEIGGEKKVTGITDGLEPGGELRIRSADNTIHMIRAGDVSALRRKDRLSDPAC